jgi:hypothetical protein
MDEEPILISGKLVSVSISGRDAAASHECVFVVAPDDNTQVERALKLDPFGSPERYEAMLRVLCTALAPGVKITVKAAADLNPKNLPIAFMIDVRLA